tara:strand:+ start:22 stop:726 length:705 start_codon:yes stop_codon:yes gene_type:complete
MADEQKTEIENTESLETKQEEQIEQQEPTILQSEVDKIVEKRLARERAKYEKKYAGVDPEEARKLIEEKEQQELEKQKQRGEFDKILKETVDKKDAELNKIKVELTKTRIDDALIKAASEQQAIKPDQVVNLLRGKVQLGEDGKPEIIGENNAPMYNDKGELLSISDYVGKFLDDNPHFKTANPSGSGSTGNVGGSTPRPFNLADLDMTNPKDREKYAQYRKERNKKPTVINLT